MHVNLFFLMRDELTCQVRLKKFMVTGRNESWIGSLVRLDPNANTNLTSNPGCGLFCLVTQSDF